jgi:acetylornithine deacetylase/succinyl-diaminopimelate desuccinylase-like protein
MVSSTVLRDRVAAAFPQTLADLESLVAIPSFVGAEPGAIERSAALTAQLLGSAGMDVRVVQAGGAPGVIGRIDVDPAAPTVLLYAHHDVQPVAADWSTDPFSPVVRDGRLYGRGSADDAAGVMVHVGALRALGGDLAVNVRAFVEGEEESGSPSLAALLDGHRQTLAADVAVIADSDNKSATIPSLTTSLRGLAVVTVSLRVADRGVHSGMWGGVYLDAVTTLARLLATLHDADGAVAVAGLESAAPGGDELTEAQARAQAGLVPSLRLAGRGSVTDRVWWGPALSVIGFDATSVADSSNTLWPEARAKLSLRVPPGADPVAAQAALVDHLERHNTSGAQLTFSLGDVGDGLEADPSGPAHKAAEAALTEAFGQPMAPVGQGGSIPLAAVLAAAFPKMEILITGVEDPDSRAHAGDESVSLEMLRKAVEAEALLLRNLAP